MTTTCDTEARPTSSFAAGDVVSASSACDSDCVWTFTVEKRTAKRITIREHGTGDVRTVGVMVSQFDGAEWARPFGSFSMCPVIRAGA